MTEFLTHEDRVTWAKTVYGEARGEPRAGQLSVAFVPFNRAQLSGRTVARECLRPWQFSCWNPGDPNRAVIEAMSAEALTPFLALIDEVLEGVKDPSQGATFYHTTTSKPRWRTGHSPCARIGHHIFYKDIAPYERGEETQ